MLTITLKEDELLRIGDNITLSFQRHADPLLKRCGNPSLTKQVKVQIEAPKTVKILRSELLAID